MLVLSIGLTVSLQAQATRTWVSGVGDDVNPCSRTAPCKTYAGAISKTAVNGIISTLDPGGFGAVTITKGILIDGSEQIAGVLAAGSNGININAPATDVVVLRGLEIHGANFSGIDGVRVTQAKAVFIEHCRIQNFSQNGIRVANASGAIAVHVRNCEIRSNNVAGILTNPTATGTVGVDVSDTLISNNGNTGIDLGGANNAITLTRVVVTNNPSGVIVESTGSVGMVESSTIVANQNGLISGSGGGTPVTRISRSFIVANSAQGLSGSGTTRCFSNNVIEGNGGNNTCTTGGIAQQ
jgi:hypothetical protein